MPHANTNSTASPAIITTTTTNTTTTACDKTTTITTSSSATSSSHDNQPQILTTTSSSSTIPSSQHHLKKSTSISSLLSHTSSRQNSLSSLSQEEEEEEESDEDSNHSEEEEEDSDDNETKQYNHSMPLLSQHTVHQLVPGSVAAQCDYPLANTKRNMEFHTLFRSVPELDPLIEVYKCALQKEILLQGHIYITEHHLCFNANIFGWVTNLVIAFSDITSIEKRMTAMIIPNGIQVSTVHAKHIFASFMSRDMAFDQMYKVWQIHHDKAKVQTLQPRNNSDFAIKQDDGDEDDLFSESSDTMSTTTDNSSTEESCSSSNEFIEDEGIVNPPHHCECHCGDNNNQHLQQIALDSTFKGTILQ
ncbi:hypothetical protein INT45_006226 [Circinella minor]|uniref:GRAM domain-containing protein n=1 Tax=Circinella minor TaxID=1195481 RepID=A0A8H7RUS5_9FUNG|nr:hypothetical protein INT45_006226 [Circinella minor]